MIYVCALCGGQSPEPHGCACGGAGIPCERLPAEVFTEIPPAMGTPNILVALDLRVGIEFGIFGPGDTGNDENSPEEDCCE